MQMFEASEAVKGIYLLFFATSTALRFKPKIMYTINNNLVTEILIIHNVQYFLCGF